MSDDKKIKIHTFWLYQGDSFKGVNLFKTPVFVTRKDRAVVLPNNETIKAIGKIYSPWTIAYHPNDLIRELGVDELNLDNFEMLFIVITHKTMQNKILKMIKAKNKTMKG